MLDETCFGVDHQTQRADFLSPVQGMTATIEKNKETSICKRARSNHRTTPVQEERSHILGGTRTCEVETDVLVDEVDAKDRLEQVADWYLTLVEDTLVFAETGFGGKVGLGDCTIDNIKSGVRELRGQFVADGRVKPAGRKRALLECLKLQELNEALDGRPEVATDAEFLESDDHVLPTFPMVLATSMVINAGRVKRKRETYLKCIGMGKGGGIVDGDCSDLNRGRMGIGLRVRVCAVIDSVTIVVVIVATEVMAVNINTGGLDIR